MHGVPERAVAGDDVFWTPKLIVQFSCVRSCVLAGAVDQAREVSGVGAAWCWESSVWFGDLCSLRERIGDGKFTLPSGVAG